MKYHFIVPRLFSRNDLNAHSLIIFLLELGPSICLITTCSLDSEYILSMIIMTLEKLSLHSSVTRVYDRICGIYFNSMSQWRKFSLSCPGQYIIAFRGVMGVKRSQINRRKTISWFHALPSTLTQYIFVKNP